MEQKPFTIKDIKNGFLAMWKHSKVYKKDLIYIFTFTILSSLTTALEPYLWGKIIDSLTNSFQSKPSTVILASVWVYLGVYTLQFIIRHLSDLARSLRARWIEENCRLDYVIKGGEHLLKLPLSYHLTNKPGETRLRIATASRSIVSVFSTYLIDLIPQFLTGIIILIILLSVMPIFGIISLVGLAFYVYLSLKEIYPAARIQKQVQKSYREAHSVADDAITNIRTVKDYGTETFEIKRLFTLFKEKAMPMWYELFSLRRKVGSYQGLIGIILRTLILGISIYLILNDRMTLGQMVAYNAYAFMIWSPLGNIVNNWRNFQENILDIQDGEKVFDEKPEEYHKKTPQPSELVGNIEFKNVYFKYEEKKEVLNNINFDVKEGQTIALVGESGVGKSTIIDLLLGYYFPTKGSILIDGMDTDKIDLELLRKSVAVVSQEISLFNETIEYNLAYGSPVASKSQIIDAARKAHALEFIDKFPKKWEQLVGEKGMKLSVGQKQRVAIARAILRDPKILILDEPTSALDAGSEKIITASLEELMRGKTTFIIAHRLSTVRKADKILVFKEGRIIEQGTHQELLQIEGGEYRRLYELQIGLHE